MSATAGVRLLVSRRERVGRRTAPGHRSVAWILRILGGAALVAVTILAITLVPGHGDFSAAVRWAMAAMALDAVISWVFIEQHLNPRRPRGRGYRR